MPRGSSAEQWAERLLRLASNPEQMADMSLRARRFAEKELGLDRLDRLIRDVVERLRAGVKSRPVASQ